MRLNHFALRGLAWHISPPFRHDRSYSVEEILVKSLGHSDSRPIRDRALHLHPVQGLNHSSGKSLGCPWSMLGSSIRRENRYTRITRSLDGCRIDANVPLAAGTVVELMLLLGLSAAVHVKAATVCWTRGQECGLRFALVHPGEAAHLERYISQRIIDAAHAQYPSR